MPLVINDGELIIGSGSSISMNCVASQEAVGCLLNNGTAIISGKIEKNWATCTDSTNSIAGGIYNIGTLCLNGKSRVSNNIAFYEDNIGIDGTGGIKNAQKGSVIITDNATITSNFGSTVGGITHYGKGGLTINGRSVIKGNYGVSVGGVLCKDGKRIQVSDAPVIVLNKSFIGNSDLKTDKYLEITGDITAFVIMLSTITTILIGVYFNSGKEFCFKKVRSYFENNK